MPKMKTHSGAKKRFRITGTGKVMREQAGGATCWSTSRSKSRRIAGTSWSRPPTSRRSRSFSASEPTTTHSRSRARCAAASNHIEGVLTWHA